MRATGTIFMALIVFAAVPTVAAPITINGITVSEQSISSDNRGINDVNLPSGFILLPALTIAGGSAGYSGASIFTPGAGSTAPPLIQALTPCQSLSTAPGFCASPVPFTNPDQRNGTWDFEVESPSGAAATFALPSAAPIPITPLPFPFSVTITNSVSGVNPKISWVLPAGVTPNAFSILIFDRGAPLAGGGDNTVHQADLPPNQTSYTFPTVLSTGQTLQIGHQYSINFQLIDTRDGTAVGTLGNLLTRSLSFFDFTPETNSVLPGNIGLPMVHAGVYHFNVGGVGPDSKTFIDPAIAVGYKYAIGMGDPNFASVILPDVGGGVFDLSFLATEVTLDADVQYFFPAGGVADFTVTGIDPAAELDPADTSAFLTGLTFVKDGSFTGTMTPLTETVPEPGSLTLLASGLLGLPLFRRGRRSVPGS